MTYYGAKQLQEGFQTVRKNTIVIAEDIPAGKYDFEAAPDVKTVAGLLAHIAVATEWQMDIHSRGVSFIDFPMFSEHRARAAAAEQALRAKDDILKALHDSGDAFAAFLGGLSEEKLQETVTFPPPVRPEARTRFEMLLGTKEHEMHHRGQLMLIERMLGIVPHLTRQREAARR